MSRYLPNNINQGRPPVMTMGAQDIVEKRTAVRFLLCEHRFHMERPVSQPLIPSFLRGDYFRDYDKTGNTSLVKAIKLAYLGSSSVKLNQERMDEFFDPFLAP